ncbi:MAG: asparagine synthase (glutamine-hydrolyzing) [Rhodospirillaceae bacterium]|nr:asparagine synthase (glutamine-hydrolyzing) [Rhodospirillaceae bacterium]
MCGIAGIIGTSRINPRAVEEMAEIQAHRGPDDSGLWANASGKIILGHRRLSIIDTSAAGHQPMEIGSHVITYNGEIYNYRELAQRLIEEGGVFDSQCDTEVLLRAYQHWGEDCLQEFNGMFAFAIFDAARNILFCARDRFGEKPFLYHAEKDYFAFASEFKALLSLKGLDADYEQDRILRFLYHPTQGLDDETQTAFSAIKQLPPAHYLTLNIETMEVETRRYWDIRSDEIFTRMSQSDAENHFRELLTDSIRLRMRSDMPLGSCLSGGIDSSSIVCIAKELRGADSPYDVFTGRFPHSSADEWQWATEIVDTTGVESHSTFPTSEGFLKELAGFIWHNELPVGSSSQYAQWCVFRQAREVGITVLLDGQGGDELLGGYEQYFQYYLQSVRGVLSNAELISEKSNIRERYPLGLLTKGQSFKQALPNSIRHILAGFTGDGNDFSFGLKASAARNLHQTLPPLPAGLSEFHPLAGKLYQEMLYTHLPVLLRYGDRNSMAHSREVRLPFCDHRLAEFVFSLPAEKLMGEAQTKRLLRGAMQGVLPDSIRLRWNKQGFLPPQADWFRAELGDLVETIIESREFSQSEIWRAGWWRRVLQRFRNGETNLASMLWRPVVENAWQENFVGRFSKEKGSRIFLDHDR